MLRLGQRRRKWCQMTAYASWIESPGDLDLSRRACASVALSLLIPQACRRRLIARSCHGESPADRVFAAHPTTPAAPPYWDSPFTLLCLLRLHSIHTPPPHTPLTPHSPLTLPAHRSVGSFGTLTRQMVPEKRGRPNKFTPNLPSPSLQLFPSRFSYSQLCYRPAI